MNNYNPFSLQGKTILVTGASSGIGQAIAIECSRMGASVLITARNEKRLLETMSLLQGEGHKYILADLTQDEDLDSIVESIDKIHGLVNNAGLTVTLPVKFMTLDKFCPLLKINTVSPIMLLSKLLKSKKIKKGASIVFTSSICGPYIGAFGNAMYGASKGAVSGFVKTAAMELASREIRVNAICPGMIKTHIFDAGVITNEQLEADHKNYPLGRYGKPEEVAYAVVYLLSDASSWITGTNLIIDGGRIINS